MPKLVMLFHQPMGLLTLVLLLINCTLTKSSISVAINSVSFNTILVRKQ